MRNILVRLQCERSEFTAANFCFLENSLMCLARWSNSQALTLYIYWGQGRSFISPSEETLQGHDECRWEFVWTSRGCKGGYRSVFAVESELVDFLAYCFIRASLRAPSRRKLSEDVGRIDLVRKLPLFNSKKNIPSNDISWQSPLEANNHFCGDTWKVERFHRIRTCVKLRLEMPLWWRDFISVHVLNKWHLWQPC